MVTIMAILPSPANEITPHILFISDLHLTANEPLITQHFFYFLEHIAPHAEALYILGDFFESYIGDDDPDPFIPTIITALKKVSDAGLPIFFMPGNRDFLLGKRFAKQAGIQRIPDPFVTSLYGKSTLLMHGDFLCIDDKGHQRFRRITGNKLLQALFLLLPISFRQKLARQLRDESQQYNQVKSAEIMDVNENAVNQAIEKNHAILLIHGHTHKPMITEKRIVLGAWHEKGNYLRVDSAGKIEWVEFER